MVYNPLEREVQKTLTLPLYYTGLTDKAAVTERNGSAQSLTLKRDYSVELPVTVSARGVTWFVFE